MEIVITKYTLTFSILAEVVVVLKVVLDVLGISKRVQKVAVEQIPLQLYILLRVGVLKRGKVSKKEAV